MERETEKSGLVSFKPVAKRALIQASMAALVILAIVLVWQASTVFLVAFAGILAGVFFHSLASWTSDKTNLPETWSLGIVLLLLLILLVALAWWIAPSISEQTDRLSERIPQSWEQIKKELQRHEWARQILDHKEQLRKMAPDGSNALSTASGVFGATFNGLSYFVIALVVGIFLAANPAIYMNGVIALVPPAGRARAREVLCAVGTGLQSWLLAKIVAMAVIGVLTVVGLWVIGIELALVLGLIAALLSFIPNIGPILALVPAILMGLLAGADKVIYVVLLYTAIQTFESYLLTPLLQQRVVDLPPALTILMQFLFGVLAGMLGLFLATPLTAALMVAAQKIYIEGVLGDK